MEVIIVFMNILYQNKTKKKPEEKSDVRGHLIGQL
jgi:hypothetical protein